MRGLNPNKMKPGKCFIIQIAIATVAVVFSFNVVAQIKPLQLTKEQAIEDFHWLRFSLEYIHPRLYKYEDKQTVDSRFDSLEKVVNKDISGVDFLSLITKANAHVRCGHLFTIPQNELGNEVLEKKVLPFYIKIINKRLYVFNDCSPFSIPNGSQILSINGNSDTSILNKMFDGVPADGYIETRKIRLMERYFNYSFQGFDLYYYLFVDRSARFKVDFINFGTTTKKTATIEGISIQQRQKILFQKYKIEEDRWFKTPSPRFKIDRQNSFAVLTVSRSFYNKNIDPGFDSLLSAAFRSIKENKISNLILDLRNNEGGDEGHQMALMSYLYNAPFKLYQNIYLSHLDFRPLKPIIIERDTSELLFNNDDEYMRKINDNLWINNYEYSDNLQLKAPKADIFSGQLYVLMDGTCFSSAGDLIADLKKVTNAIFIGEESGGTFEGPTGGSAIVIQLPNSKIMIRISPNIQMGYLYQKHPIGRGVMPTYQINYTVKDLIDGKDLEMELAKKLIKKS